MAEQADGAAQLSVLARRGVDRAEQRAARRSLRQQDFQHLGMPSQERSRHFPDVGRTPGHGVRDPFEQEIRDPGER